MSIKNFISNSIISNPERYAVDGGDLHLINDYFTSQKWQPLTREQHVSIANLIRGRIMALKDNPLDMRRRFKPKEEPSQADIYSLIGDATIETYGSKTGSEVQKVLSYLGRHPLNVKHTPSRIKKSIRGEVGIESINLSKFVFTVCSKKETKKASTPHYTAKRKIKGRQQHEKCSKTERVFSSPHNKEGFVMSSIAEKSEL